MNSIKKFKINSKVFDKWYFYERCFNTPIHGVGKVAKITNKSVYVRFNKEIVRYDNIHANKFLFEFNKKNIEIFAIK